MIKKWNIFIGALFALLLFAVPSAHAIDETHYPTTLIDSTCTDDNATPAPAAQPSSVVRPAAQTGGTADGLCDHDARILTGAIIADTVFTIASRSSCYLALGLGTTVTGGDTKWRLSILSEHPVTGSSADIDVGALVTGAVGNFIFIGLSTNYSASGAVFLNVPVMNPLFLELDLQTATSWTGNLSLLECG